MRSSGPRSTSTSGEPGAGVDPPADTTEELAARAREGDRAAFRRLYERFAPMVHGVLVAGAPPDEADDLMQQVFLASWCALDRLRQPERFGPWLAGIARNHVRRRHRRRGPRHEPLRAPLAEELAAPAERAPDERAERALAALRALPAAYRETLALRLVEGLSGPEIAAACGLTPGSVRVNLTRGMKLLRDRLGREDTT